jgi:glycosyltransferase involved in cell wall biosynthesis
MTAPTFTVVLAAYNEEKWVASAIRSVLNQTRKDFELLVVDDGSTDATNEVAREFESDSRVRVIGQDNKGRTAALNAAIAITTAPYVSLVDADDLWMPTYLESLGRALDENPDAGFAYTDAWCLDDASGRFWRVSSNAYMGEPDSPPRDPEEFLRLLLRANFVFGLATIRRTALEKAGGFNESLRAAQEYELWLRLLADGFQVARAPGQLVVVRDRAGAIHTNKHRGLENLGTVYRMVVEDLDTSEQVTAIARQRLAEVEKERDSLDLDNRLTRTRRQLRSRLARIYKGTLGRSFWYPGTPPEVAAAFPELARRKKSG